MIDAIGLFVARHVRSHIKRILQTTHPYLAGLFSILISFNQYGLGSHFSIDQSFALFQNYDSVVFGFTATATAIMLTIASSSFLKFISSTEIDGRTAYRTAVFVLAWNGFVHSIAFAAIFVAKNSLLWDSSLKIMNLDQGQKYALAVVLWLQFYAFFQFMVTNLALFEVSDLFGMFLKTDKPQD